MFDEYASPLSTSNNGNSFYSLIDRCRMSVIVDQVSFLQDVEEEVLIDFLSIFF